MVRNLMQDIVPPDKRSIKRIPVQEIRARKTSSPSQTVHIKPTEEEETPAQPVAPHRPRFTVPEDSRQQEPAPGRFEPSMPYVRESYDPGIVPDTHDSGRQRSKWLWIIAGVSVIILFFAFSYFFTGATLEVIAREQTVTVSESLTARKDAVEGLSYSVMTVSRQGDKEIPATGKQEVQRKASGTIIIYNNHSTASQGLVANTRFETPGGLIYRISKDVTVPGQKTEGGKTVPGSIEVTVYADQAGEKYNIGNVDFTIPGFKGDPKFKTIYARSKTPMTGGFAGTMNAVDPQTLESTRTTLRNEIASVLVSEAKAQKPAGTVVFDALVAPTYESLPETNAADGTSVTLHEKVTLSIVLLPEAAFSAALAKDIEQGTAGVSIKNADALQVTMTSRPESVNAGTISFTVNGAPHFVWNINQDAVKTALANTSKSSMSTILEKFPEISEADATLRPFWRRSFPVASDISITVENQASN